MPTGPATSPVFSRLLPPACCWSSCSRPSCGRQAFTQIDARHTERLVFDEIRLDVQRIALHPGTQYVKQRPKVIRIRNGQCRVATETLVADDACTIVLHDGVLDVLVKAQRPV